MTANGDQPERLNSRTITAWLSQPDREYLDKTAVKLGLTNRDGGPNRNGALKVIIAAHRVAEEAAAEAERQERLAKRRERRRQAASTVDA